MAWIESERRFMEREERDQVAERIAAAIKRLQASGIANLSDDDYRDYQTLVDDHKRLKRITRAEGDLLYFAHEYFGELYNPGNDGNWIPNELADAPQFHREICADMDHVSTVERNGMVAEAAPRSHAKSSYLSKAFPMRELVFRSRRYTILISETPDVAEGNVEWIANQLKHNKKLRADFGPLLDQKKQNNPLDNAAEFVAWYTNAEGELKQLALVQAASSNQALRGRNWNGMRPDLIICDDLEGKKNTNTPALRRELRHWFSSVVMPLGDPKGEKTAFVYMGTIVCESSLLEHVIEERSDFKSRRYKAVIEWPQRMELWDECRAIYQDRTNGNRKEDAMAFYEANREEMDRGVVVLWPEVQPIWKLMTWRWDNGSYAFSTEYQNDPLDEESRVFVSDNFVYWSDKDPNKTFPRETFKKAMGIDLAFGKERGDYSAIVTVAKHKREDATYVLDAFGDKITGSKFIEAIVERVRRYWPDRIAAEAQMGQELFVNDLIVALEQIGYPAAKRVKKVFQNRRGKKDERIESLQPKIETGALLFHRGHHMLLEQLDKYGTKTNDDLPDALEMAVHATELKVATVKKWK